MFSPSWSRSRRERHRTLHHARRLGAHRAANAHALGPRRLRHAHRPRRRRTVRSVPRPQPEAAAGPRRRQPDPGALFIRAARLVQNCVLGYARLAAGLPLTRFTLPRAATPQAAKPAGDSRAEPLRQALRTVTRNHPHGAKLLSAGLENLATALAAAGQETATLPDLFRRICNESGIRLEPAHWRKIARDPAFELRPAPA